MKLRNLFAVAMASAVLFSCTEKVIIQGPDEEEGTTRVRIGLLPGQVGASGRAGHFPAEDNDTKSPATTDELKIYNYAVFIFKSSGILEAALISKPYNTNNLFPRDYSSYGATGLNFTKAENSSLDDNGVLTLSAGSKTIFAIVNAPVSVLNDQEDFLRTNSMTTQKLTEYLIEFDDLSSIVGEYDGTQYGSIVQFDNDPDEAVLSGGSGNRGFMMTTISNTGFATDYFPQIVNDNDVYDVELSVGRAMAKVSLGSELKPKSDPDWVNDQPFGTLDTYSYKIINNPKAMYGLVRSENTILTTPYYYDGIAASPISENYHASKYFESHFSNLTATGTDPSLGTNYMPISTDTEKTFTYCIENANRTPRQGNATIAIIKGKFNPDNVDGQAVILNPADLSATGEEIDGSGDFWRVWIKKYDHNGVVGGEAYDSFGAAYYNADPTLYLDDIKDKIAGENNGWVASEIEVEVQAFPGGICYYRLPLYNENNSMAPHSVKRNSYYMIDITKVTGAGYPNEGGGVDPTDPLEPQSNITVTIKVDKWDVIKQPGII